MRNSKVSSLLSRRPFHGLTVASLILIVNLTLAACAASSSTPTLTSNATTRAIAPTKAAPTSPASALAQATATPFIIATAPLDTAAASQTGPVSVPATTQAATVNTTATSGPTPANTTPAGANGPTASGGTPVPTLPFAPAPPGYAGKLSIVGNDNAIYILRFDGKPPQAVFGKAGQSVSATNDGEIFLWPTWSKDGNRLAAIGVNVAGGQAVSSDILVSNADGTGRYKLQDQSQAQPVYLSWSPDGNFMSILSNQNSVLSLSVADAGKNVAGKPATLRPVVTGGPIFSHWAADSDSLFVHSGDGTQTPASLGIFHAKSAGANLSAFTAKPGNFRAPSFAPDGQKLAFSSPTPNLTTETINLQTKDGTALANIPLNGSGAAFAFSPDSVYLAHSYANASDGSYKGISLNNISQAAKNVQLNPTQVVNESVLGFWWSPDGKKIAYIGGNSTGDALTWNIYDLTAKKTTKLAEWLPSREWLQVIGYFDQYALSHSIWSPDSKTLVFSGYAGQSLPTNAVQPGGDPLTYLLPVVGPNAGKPQAIEPGKLAFWTE